MTTVSTHHDFWPCSGRILPYMNPTANVIPKEREVAIYHPDAILANLEYFRVPPGTRSKQHVSTIEELSRQLIGLGTSNKTIMDAIMIELKHASMCNQVNYWQAVHDCEDPTKNRGEVEQLRQGLQDVFIELWIAQRYFEFVLLRDDSAADYLMVQVPKELAQQDAVTEGTPLMDDGPYH
ncbi:hypothetical protein FIBSPDRAFT_884131 [Athelia psychrophila]|uniref:Uncharacterized protein n=1 Tax=Athelia psychrophila TaxID=1759441 RepID=A0A166TGU4_9AGAM|nr:hypothetical protein FIBSPDRAFT_884131 [Fibularhizoctonia sp. CBS 109695]